jgi:hypothetical protein
MTTATTDRQDVRAASWFISKDLKKAATELGDNEIRYLVDSYYAAQDVRKQSEQRVNAAADAGEPNDVLYAMAADARRLEDNIRSALDRWGRERDLPRWGRSITGIGPVIAAGLSAHTHIEHLPTAGHLWSFAGLNPESKWLKGEKRPWNASLKTLCWKIGESFVKVSGNEKDIYGKVYIARKAFEHEQNDLGAYAAQAAQILKDRPGHAQKKTYAEGKLPDGHIHSRAKRYAVKLFLSHWHHVAYEIEYGEAPPMPYIFSDQAKVKGLGEHVHYTGPPNWPLDDPAA